MPTTLTDPIKQDLHSKDFAIARYSQLIGKRFAIVPLIVLTYPADGQHFALGFLWSSTKYM